MSPYTEVSRDVTSKTPIRRSSRIRDINSTDRQGTVLSSATAVVGTPHSRGSRLSVKRKSLVLTSSNSDNIDHKPRRNSCGARASEQFGLPEEIFNKYCECRKIKQLYDWQKDCLSDHRVLRGSNCILSLPTGAGKTLVAEMLILREAAVNKRSSLLVLPYVAIVQEKMNSMSKFEDAFDLRIEEYASSKGRLPPIKRRNRVSVYVATIEKANMLINSLIDTDSLDSIGLVVVDELHMLGEPSRGSTIEQLLNKFMYKGTGQVVGMSATLANMGELSTFLRAFVYSTNFRPVELQEFVKMGQTMYKVLPDGALEQNDVLPPNKLSSQDADGVCQLLQSFIPRRSVIIFCPTKKGCENLALKVSKLVPKAIREHRANERNDVVEAIKHDNDGKIDDILERAIFSGIAFHHAGLTHDERKHVEAAYAEGSLCVLCATTTLAAGVNLPGRLVIIKSPMAGPNVLSKAQYLQMIGRAGRPGFDDKGTAVTIVHSGVEERKFRQMLEGPIPTCRSAMDNSDRLLSFVLDVFALKMAKNMHELLEVFRYSLLIVQIGFEQVRELAMATVEQLISNQMLSQDEEGQILATQLGNATFNANLSPAEAQIIEDDVMKILQSGLILSSHFHLLYTIAPYNTSCNVNWDFFFEQFKLLTTPEKAVLEQCGLHEKGIVQSYASGKKMEAGDPAMRLYLAMLLRQLWNQETHHDIAERFCVERGWLQSMLQSSLAQAGNISRFAERIPSLWPLRLLLPELVQKLSDCVHVELIPLLQIEGVKRIRARQLFSSGYKSVALVAKASSKDLVRDVQFLKPFQAKKIINSAKMLLRDQVDEKVEEMAALGVNVDFINTNAPIE